VNPTADLMDLLKGRYPSTAYAVLEEVRDRAGFAANGAADAIVMGLWPSRGLHLEGFELKVTRYDWQRERKKPEKAESWFGYCDFWWLVINDPTIVQDGELPEPWGLLVAKGGKLHTARPAKRLDPKPIDRHQLAALLKRASSMAIDVSEQQLEKARLQGVESAKDLDAYRIERAESALKERVAEFEKASGVRLQGYDSATEIGSAVRAVLDGRKSVDLQRLRHVRDNVAGVLEKLDHALAVAP